MRGVAELGTGTIEFETLAEDSELSLIAGPQGGHHFIVHARMSGLLPGDPTMPGLIDNPSTRFAVEGEDGQRLDVDMAPYRLGYQLAGDGTEDVFELTSGRILQVQEARVEDILGSRVKILLEVTDVRGAVAADERWIRAVEEVLPGGDAGPPPDAG